MDQPPAVAFTAFADMWPWATGNGDRSHLMRHWRRRNFDLDIWFSVSDQELSIHIFIYSYFHIFIFSYIHIFIYSYFHIFIFSYIHIFIYSYFHIFIFSYIHIFFL